MPATAGVLIEHRGHRARKKGTVTTTGESSTSPPSRGGDTRDATKDGDHYGQMDSGIYCRGRETGRPLLRSQSSSIGRTSRSGASVSSRHRPSGQARMQSTVSETAIAVSQSDGADAGARSVPSKKSGSSASETIAPRLWIPSQGVRHGPPAYVKIEQAAECPTRGVRPFRSSVALYTPLCPLCSSLASRRLSNNALAA